MSKLQISGPKAFDPELFSKTNSRSVTRALVRSFIILHRFLDLGASGLRGQ